MIGVNSVGKDLVLKQSYLSIRNYKKLQHFKKKRPPWIKIYTALPLDYPFINLREDAKLTFVFLTIVASEHDNRIPFDIPFLGKRLAIDTQTIINQRQLFKLQSLFKFRQLFKFRVFCLN